MKWIRRLLLELWAILMLAGIVGFLGPFGTYLAGDFLSRLANWWALLMGAYILVRPTMIAWRWIARATGLPRGSLVFWGVVVSSFPMTFLWRAAGRDEMKLLHGVSGLLPFALLCSFAVMTVAWWARRADAHLMLHYDGGTSGRPADRTVARQGSSNRTIGDSCASEPPSHASRSARARLYARLSPQFDGEILALESEDHYVRVHGRASSELLLMRLRDAIAEMDGSPGEQTHRSWWVARPAVADIVGNGRNREIVLVNGTRSPVARDSVERLQRSGFLPS